QKFEDLGLEHDILSFIRDLGHSGDIIYLSDDQSILRRNKMFWYTAQDDTMFIAMRCISRHEDTQKPDSDTSPKKKPVQATKGTRLKTKDKLATKRSKTQFHSSHASGSGDGVDTQSKVPDEQHLKTIGADKGTGTILGVPDVPKYEFKSKKESWGDIGEEDKDDENDSEDKSDGNDDDDANDDDNQEGDDTNDNDEETDSDSTESDRIKILVLNQSSTEYYEEEEEKIDDEETMDEEEDDEVTKELYDDVNVNLGNEDTDITNADQGALEQQNKADEPVQSSSFSSDFTSKLLNLENPSPADNEIASLMETSALHAMAVPEITFGFTTTIPPLPLVTNLEKDLSKIKQVDQYAQALSSIPAIVD
ncbi:hypothetical protein Tco_1119296, partial [Tanacetum coccineum]